MFNREQAIKKIKEIRNGSGLNREQFPDEAKGSIAKDFWNSCEFTLGAEYGYIIALMEAFDIEIN